MGTDRYDAIVVGLGVMGSATCMELSRRGLAVLGLEQFGPLHNRGSSHGQTRVIRKAYFEDPRYVPMVRRSFELWQELETDSGQALLYPAGCLNIGPPGHPAICGVRRSVTEHGLVHELLNAEELHRRWPVFECSSSDIAVYEADAGILLPERCVGAFREIARRCGADLRFDAKVLDWSVNGAGVVVQTTTEEFEGGNLIVAAGPWLSTIAADLNLPLTVERQAQLWFQPAEPALFQRERMPIFIHFDADRSYYGIPIVPADPPFDQAVKIARHHGGAITMADQVSRELTSEDEADVRTFIQSHLPQANGPIIATKVCLYTNTPDDHFIIDRHPRHGNVYIAGGFSGHGFKFAPLVAEILADWISTDPHAPAADLFSIARFGSRG